MMMGVWKERRVGALIFWRKREQYAGKVMMEKHQYRMMTNDKSDWGCHGCDQSSVTFSLRNEKEVGRGFGLASVTVLTVFYRPT